MQNVVKRNPIADLPSLRKVCNHPRVLADSEKRFNLGELKAPEPDESIDRNAWWQPCSVDKLEMSGKILIFFSILAECEVRGEKLLVFSGCLSTLNVIELFLKTITEKMRSLNPPSSELKGIWARDVDYFRLDGTSNAEKRRRDITAFNQKSNIQARYTSMISL